METVLIGLLVVIGVIGLLILLLLSHAVGALKRITNRLTVMGEALGVCKGALTNRPSTVGIVRAGGESGVHSFGVIDDIRHRYGYVVHYDINGETSSVYGVLHGCLDDALCYYERCEAWGNGVVFSDILYMALPGLLRRVVVKIEVERRNHDGTKTMLGGYTKGRMEGTVQKGFDKANIGNVRIGAYYVTAYLTNEGPGFAASVRAMHVLTLAMRAALGSDEVFDVPAQVTAVMENRMAFLPMYDVRLQRVEIVKASTNKIVFAWEPRDKGQEKSRIDREPANDPQDDGRVETVCVLSEDAVAPANPNMGRGMDAEVEVIVGALTFGDQAFPVAYYVVPNQANTEAKLKALDHEVTALVTGTGSRVVDPAYTSLMGAHLRERIARFADIPFRISITNPDHSQTHYVTPAYAVSWDCISNCLFFGLGTDAPSWEVARAVILKDAAPALAANFDVNNVWAVTVFASEEVGTVGFNGAVAGLTAAMVNMLPPAPLDWTEAVTTYQNDLLRYIAGRAYLIRVIPLVHGSKDEVWLATKEFMDFIVAQESYRLEAEKTKTLTQAMQVAVSHRTPKGDDTVSNIKKKKPEVGIIIAPYTMQYGKSIYPKVCPKCKSDLTLNPGVFIMVPGNADCVGAMVSCIKENGELRWPKQWERGTEIPHILGVQCRVCNETLEHTVDTSDMLGGDWKPAAGLAKRYASKVVQPENFGEVKIEGEQPANDGAWEAVANDGNPPGTTVPPIADARVQLKPIPVIDIEAGPLAPMYSTVHQGAGKSDKYDGSIVRFFTDEPCMITRGCGHTDELANYRFGRVDAVDMSDEAAMALLRCLDELPERTSNMDQFRRSIAQWEVFSGFAWRAVLGHRDGDGLLHICTPKWVQAWVTEEGRNENVDLFPVMTETQPFPVPTFDLEESNDKGKTVYLRMRHAGEKLTPEFRGTFRDAFNHVSVGCVQAHRSGVLTGNYVGIYVKGPGALGDVPAMYEEIAMELDAFLSSPAKDTKSANAIARMIYNAFMQKDYINRPWRAYIELVSGETVLLCTSAWVEWYRNRNNPDPNGGKPIDAVSTTDEPKPVDLDGQPQPDDTFKGAPKSMTVQTINLEPIRIHGKTIGEWRALGAEIRTEGNTVYIKPPKPAQNIVASFSLTEPHTTMAVTRVNEDKEPTPYMISPEALPSASGTFVTLTRVLTQDGKLLDYPSTCPHCGSDTTAPKAVQIVVGDQPTASAEVRQGMLDIDPLATSILLALPQDKLTVRCTSCQIGIKPTLASKPSFTVKVHQSEADAKQGIFRGTLTVPLTPELITNMVNDVPADVIALIHSSKARQYRIVPFNRVDNRLWVVSDEAAPNDGLGEIDIAYKVHNTPVSTAALQALLDHYYPAGGPGDGVTINTEGPATPAVDTASKQELSAEDKAVLSSTTFKEVGVTRGMLTARTAQGWYLLFSFFVADYRFVVVMGGWSFDDERFEQMEAFRRYMEDVIGRGIDIADWGKLMDGQADGALRQAHGVRIDGPLNTVARWYKASHVRDDGSINPPPQEVLKPSSTEDVVPGRIDTINYKIRERMPNDPQYVRQSKGVDGPFKFDPDQTQDDPEFLRAACMTQDDTASKHESITGSITAKARLTPEPVNMEQASKRFSIPIGTTDPQEIIDLGTAIHETIAQAPKLQYERMHDAMGGNFRFYYRPDPNNPEENYRLIFDGMRAVFKAHKNGTWTQSDFSDVHGITQHKNAAFHAVYLETVDGVAHVNCFASPKYIAEHKAKQLPNYNDVIFMDTFPATAFDFWKNSPVELLDPDGLSGRPATTTGLFAPGTLGGSIEVSVDKKHARFHPDRLRLITPEEFPYKQKPTPHEARVFALYQNNPVDRQLLNLNMAGKTIDGYIAQATEADGVMENFLIHAGNMLADEKTPVAERYTKLLNFLARYHRTHMFHATPWKLHVSVHVDKQDIMACNDAYFELAQDRTRNRPTSSTQ